MMRVFASVVVAMGAIVLLPARVDAGLLSCTISATPVAFGNYNVFSLTPVDTTGTITYQCDFVVLPTITLSQGGASSYSPRVMSNGAAALNYNLYQDALRVLVWGDGTGGTVTYLAAVSGLNVAVQVPVYGRIPAQQNVSVGLYTDTIVATIHF